MESNKPKILKLYNGRVVITFDPVKHVFRHTDGKRIDGVTSATSKIDKSAPLMGWSVKMMALYLKQHWNSKMSKNDFEELVEKAKKEYRRVKEEAANIGTEIHQWCEDWIKGKKLNLPDNEPVRNGVMAFMKWKKETHIEITDSERIVYSRKHDFAGIMDWAGKEKAGKSFNLIVGDFKTSSGIYNEMRYQLSGYWLALEEETGKKYDKGFIVQFGKEDGEFKTLEIPRSEHLKNKKAFLSALEIKRRESEIQKSFI